MNCAFRNAAPIDEEIDFEEILRSARRKASNGAPEGGPRTRRRAARARLAETGALAAILGIQGCLPVAGEAPAMTAPEPQPEPEPTPSPSPPPPPAPDPGGAGSNDPAGDSYAVHENATTEIQVAELLQGEADAAEIIGVVRADNGVAELHGSVVRFTPAAGYSGPAKIVFSYKDDAGRTRSGEFEILVDDDAAIAQGHDSTDPSGGDGAGHDHEPDQSAPHGDDPGKQEEHMALMDLVPVSEATHVAVKSGSWFDPATWANGEIPGEGAKVVIPEGLSVDYDGESDASIFTIRVDGQLDFATDRDTFLEVDTMVVTGSGHLTIGTEDNPVAPGVEAVIQIAANGPIDVSWDPLLLSRGVITHGEIDIYGAEKDSFIKVAADPMKGDTSLLLESAPDGWRVGDTLVLTGTHLGDKGPASKGEPYDQATTEDEVLTIARIEGSRIYFDRALEYDHEGPRADLKAYAANYTRNVRIQTEGGASTPVHERGHVMFMHSDDVDVRYAEFFELGRTDKSERAAEAVDLESVSPDSNVKARYPVHIHRAGVGEPDSPAMIVGNAVWGSPGWGYVHHDSNAILADNAAYNVFGAAFVAETGNETGRWVDNIAIKSIGVNIGPKDGDDYHAFDQARGGIGFWFEGRMVEAVDNVAAGMPGGHGFVYMSRIPQYAEIPVDPAVVGQNEKLRYLDSNHINEPNISAFSGNEAFAVYRGLEVIKNGPKQNNDVRTVIEDFQAWEVVQGTILQYTGHYTLKNLDLVGTETTYLRHDTLIGLWYGTNTFDVVVDGAEISGFKRGVQLRHESLFDGVDNFRYIFIDTNIEGAQVDYNGLLPQDTILTGAAVTPREISYDSQFGAIIEGPDRASDPPLILYGAKIDSLGQTETSTDWDPFQITYWSLRGAVEQNGYWETDDGRRVTLVEEYVADRVTGHLEKFALWVELPSELSLTPNFNFGAVRVAPEFHGRLDLDNAAPVANDDSVQVGAGESIVIDVLSNDSDPEGGAIELDNFWGTLENGRVIKNDDGTLTYFADPGGDGVDEFSYWVTDDQGNFTMAEVVVTVDA